MITLALDTSGTVGSVAVARSDDDGAAEVVASVTIERGMRHGVELFPALERALEQAGVGARELDLVAVGIGPGSYTGLRVGITAARALAYACGAELLGVPTCDALADSLTPGDRPLAVVIDARVRAVYLAIYEPVQAEGRWERRDGPTLLPPVGAADRVPAGALVVGDGPDAHDDAFRRFSRATAPHASPAAHVARLALLRHRDGERGRIDDVVPLYLRRSSAELRHEERANSVGSSADADDAGALGEETT